MILSPVQVSANAEPLYAHALFKTPSKRFDTVENIFVIRGMPISTLVRKTNETINSEEQIQLFGSTFQHGKKGTSCPRRGKFMCNVVGCTWNVAYTYVKKQSGYIILDKGQSNVKYNTHLCLNTIIQSMKVT